MAWSGQCVKLVSWSWALLWAGPAVSVRLEHWVQSWPGTQGTLYFTPDSFQPPGWKKAVG